MTKIVNADPIGVSLNQKIETQMIQNSIFTFKRIDEQNGSLHQHKSTLAVNNYYQGFKRPSMRLVLREFQEKNRRHFGWTSLVRSSKWRPRHSTEANFNKIYNKPAYKTKKAVHKKTTKPSHLRQIVKQLRSCCQLKLGPYLTEWCV